MAIPESQLETWTHIGAAAQSSTTYQSIKGVIEHKDAPYATQRIDCESASNFDPRQNRRKLLIDKPFVRNRPGHDWTPMDSRRNL